MLTLRIRTLYTLNGTGIAVGIGNRTRTKRTGVQIPAGTCSISLPKVKTGPEVHPATYTIGIGILSRG
jgi:hypothetical protein